MTKRVIGLLLVVVISVCVTYSFAENPSENIPDVSGLSLEELLQLQGNVNEVIADGYTYTLLPGIYDCEKDFKWDWYNCKVLPGPNGEIRTATITFHEFTPSEDAFLTYEVSSEDAGLKLSLLKTDSSAGLYMVVSGAPLEAIPYSGF